MSLLPPSCRRSPDAASSSEPDTPLSVSQTRLFALGLALLGLVAIAATHGDYGISWDEPVQSRFGEGVLQYFASVTTLMLE